MDEKKKILEKIFGETYGEGFSEYKLQEDPEKYGITSEQAVQIIRDFNNDEIDSNAFEESLSGIQPTGPYNEPWLESGEGGNMPEAQLEIMGADVRYQRNPDGTLKRDPDTGQPIALTQEQLLDTNVFAPGFLDIIRGTLYNQTASPLRRRLLFEAFQAAGIGKEEDFVGATLTPASIEHIETILEYANDRYGHIYKDSPEYKELTNTELNYFYPWASEEESDDVKFSWNLLARALTDFAIDEEAQQKAKEALEHEEYMKGVAKQVAPPGPDEMEEIIKSYWKQSNVKRDPTDKELSDLSEFLAEKYNQKYLDLKALDEAVRANEIYADYRLYNLEGEITDELDAAPGGTVAENRFRLPAVTEPLFALQAEIDKETATEQELIQAGEEARKRQAGILSFMIAGR
tara:strand:- start:5017 stop:6228 length:1212 start_codon:yes stop_codon:yes gene_type:complete